MASREERMAALKKLAKELGIPLPKTPVQNKARGGMAKKMMRGGSVQPKRMRGGGMAKMAKKKMMRGGMAKKK